MGGVRGGDRWGGSKGGGGFLFDPRSRALRGLPPTPVRHRVALGEQWIGNLRRRVEPVRPVRFGLDVYKDLRRKMRHFMR